MKGFHVGAADGPMGHVDDFIVDESTWQTRYLVIDTSNWMGGKWVAVSPESVSHVDWANQSLKMNLTREEIRNSPSLDEAHVPSYEQTPRFVIL